jgi:hypothetical protein
LWLPWPLALRIPSFTVGRVRVDKIGKRKAREGERIA